MADSAKITLQKMQIKYDTIIRDLQNEKNKMQDMIDKQGKEIMQLRSENKTLKSSENISKITLTEEDTIKKILSFYAKGYTYKTISEKLKFNNIVIQDIDFIKDICQNIEDLDNKFLLYYKQEVKDYEEQLKIKPDLIKDQLAQILKNLINDASMDLDNLSDIVEKGKLRKEINDHAKELNKLLGNIVESEKVQDFTEEVNKVMKTYEENKIISFKAERKKVSD